MNTAKSIDHQILHMKSGKLFSYQDIPEYSGHGDAVVKALSRKTKNAEVVRLKKGLYYKPEKGSFGNMSPKDSDIIKYFTLEKKKVVGYVTGLALYHRWGLTTQVPFEVTIATSKNKREKVDVSGLRILTIPARTKVTKNNTAVLQFLDVIKSVDQIPDTTSEEIIKKLASKISAYKTDEIHEMEKLAIDAYTPRTKALLGAFLETHLNYYSESIHKALNPTSKYKIFISDATFKDQERWNICPK
jgi:predicted transcriptional regulator of viral defense system